MCITSNFQIKVARHDPVIAAVVCRLLMTLTLTLNLLAVLVGALAIRGWKKQGVQRHEIVGRLGFTRSHAVRDFCFGLAVAFAAMLSAVCVAYGFKTLTFESASSANLLQLATHLKIFAMAFAEELGFRAFFIAGLVYFTRSPFAAVAISSLLFGLAHVNNSNATILSVTSTAVGGVMYALPLVWTRRIWFSVGLHFGWNWFQGVLFGMPMSGTNFHSIINFKSHGPTWWDGGDYGPEGGLLGIGTRCLVVLLTALVCKSLSLPDKIHASEQ
ncbi:CPBP family intramembrane metalloprotease [bacterium]|nr:CPBP family intramembrane metalloprotease [bacterium]